MATSDHEAEVIERRLRPVYDAIDNGQNKKAIQQADKILKKSPNLHCAKALKALALLRVGRNDEGAKLVDEVIQTQPGDTATLQATFMYCRELGDYNKIVVLYESAAKGYPNNEEILTHLFMSYVRVGDYQKQQQTAAQLLKRFPKNAPYYCWRVMSTIMQAHSTSGSNPGQANKMFLSLAEKLMEKYVADKRAETEAEIRLYLMVLKDLQRHEKMLEVVTGELGGRVRYPDELLSHELTSLTALKQWKRMAERLHPQIIKSPDSWNYLKLYIAAQVNQSVSLKDTSPPLPSLVGEEHEGTGEDKSADTPLSAASWLSPVYEAKKFLDSLTSGAEDASPPLCRGPYLAQIQLLRELDKNDISVLDNGFSTVLLLMVDYFKRFSSKNCCYDDMKSYLSLLNEEEKKELLSRLEQFVNENPVNFDCDETEIKGNIQNLYRHISLLKLQHQCGVYTHLPAEEKLSLVAQYQKRFEDGLAFGLSLPSTVNQHSDYYIIQAAHLMMEVYGETGDPATLWNCAVMLETAQRQSRTNPQIQLLLMKIYGYLGAVEFCTRLYNSLAIKHVQVDTLGYLANRYIQTMGAFGFSGQMFRIALRFYTTCNKETMDHVTSAYKNGVFIKILEIIQLRDRLHQSHGFYSLGTEYFQLEFLQEATSLKQVREFLLGDKLKSVLPFAILDVEGLCSLLVDNRDLEVFDVWSPEHSVTDEEKRLTFTLETMWIKLKLNIIQLLKQLVSLETESSKEAAVLRLRQLKVIIEECQHLEGIEFLKKKQCLLLPIQSPPPCQLLLFVTSNYGRLLSSCVDVTLDVLDKGHLDKGSVTAVQESLKEITSSIRGIPLAAQEKIMSSTSAGLWTIGSHPYQFLLETKLDVEAYVLLIVVSSWINVMWGVCLELLVGAGSRPSGGKKKKKGKATGAVRQMTEGVSVSLLRDVLTDFKASLLSLSTQFRPFPSDEKDLAEKLSKLTLSEDNHLGKVRDEVCAGVLESYNTSFKDCQEMVHSQTTLANSILNLLPSQFRKEGKTTSGTSKEEEDYEKKENLNQANKMED